MRYQPLGPLLPGTFYLRRDVDQQLLRCLEGHGWCHLLSPRQVGKSSLRRAVGDILRKSNVLVMEASLMGMLQSDETTWCHGVLTELFKSANERKALIELLSTSTQVAPLARFTETLRRFAQENKSRGLVLFLDEFDGLLELPAVLRRAILRNLRDLFNARDGDTALQSMGVCLIGGQLPIRFTDELNRSPFITRITVSDFTRVELRGMELGLRGLGRSEAEVMDAVFAWTGGHPAMTQNLCLHLVEDGPFRGPIDARVEAMVKKLYLDRKPYQDEILQDADQRFEKAGDDKAVADELQQYARLLEKGGAVVTSARVREGLWISGLVKLQGDKATPRSEIFRRVFDRAWVDQRLASRFGSGKTRAWIDAGRPAALLLAGGELQRFQKVPVEALTLDELAFLHESQREEERRRARRTLVFSLLPLSFAAALLSVLAWSLWRQTRAEQQARRAEQGLLRAQGDRHDDDVIAEALQQLRTGTAPSQAVTSVLRVIAGRRRHHLPDRDRTLDVLLELAARSFCPGPATTPGRDAVAGTSTAPPGIMLAASPEGRCVARALDSLQVELHCGDGNPTTIRMGSGAAIGALMLSPDGRHLLARDEFGGWYLSDDSQAFSALVPPEDAPLRSAVFSADNRVLALGTARGSIQLQSLSTSQNTRLVAGGTASQASVAMSDDATRLAATDTEGVLRVWDVSSGQVAQSCSSPPSERNWTFFSPGGAGALSVSAEGFIRWLPLASGGPATHALAQVGSISTVLRAPRGERLALVGEEAVVLWEMPEDSAGSPRRGTVLRGARGSVRDVAFNPEGTLIASAEREGTVKVWSATTGALLTVLDGSSRGFMKVAWLQPDRVVALDPSGNLFEWNLRTPRAVTTLSGRTGTVRNLRASPDWSWLLSVGSETAELWHRDTTSWTSVARVPRAASVALSPDGRHLVVATDDGTIERLDDGVRMNPVPLESLGARSEVLAFSRDGAVLLTRAGDVLTRRRWPDLSAIQPTEGLDETETFLAVNAEVQRLYTLTSEGLRQREFGRGGHARVPPDAGRVYTSLQLVLSPGGAYALGLGDNPAPELWDLRTTLPGGLRTSDSADASASGPTRYPSSAAFSRDDAWLLLGHADGRLVLLDVASRRVLSVLSGHEGRIAGLSFASDRHDALSWSDDGTVCLWRFAETPDRTTRPAATFRLEGEPQMSAVLSEDARRVAIAGSGPELRLWTLDEGALLHDLCGCLLRTTSSSNPADAQDRAWCSGHDTLPP